MVVCCICVFRLLVGLTLYCAATDARKAAVRKSFALDNEMLKALAAPNLPSMTENFAYILTRMVRAVNTGEHRNARLFIQRNLFSLGWDIEEDSFEAQTPIGKRNFTNLIARLTPAEPPGSRRYLVLASHYDTKTLEGSSVDLDWTDGGVACAMILGIATMLKQSLKSHALKNHRNIPSLMLIFFDGKEAFKFHSPVDSLYGSKHLAERWEKERRLQDIELLVLLNLMGTAHPVYYSYWNTTETWHKQLARIEMRMARLGLLEKYKIRKHPRYFQLETSSMRIDDDHVPFLLRGVPSLHLIPEPFPPCWPLACTAAENLDWPTTENIEYILRAFIVSFLGLRRPIPFDQPGQALHFDFNTFY